MSNISSKSLSTPMFQAAGGKGDGGGNGSGGMYFGDGGEDPNQEGYGGYNYDNMGWGPSADTGDIPFTTPLFGETPQGLAAWKLALAKTLYEQVKSQPVQAPEAAI